MQVSYINTLEQVDQIKADWETTYLADPHAHFFVSWTWLRGWFSIIPFSWFVLAARVDENSPFVAFFPLNIRFLHFYKLKLIRELRMGGKPLGGYTGFVCLSEYEEEAITAFATYLQHQIGWDSFQMEHVLDPRLEIFLKHFSKDKFNFRHIDCIASTYISLPDSWEQYLQHMLGKSTRQTLRRRIKKIEQKDGYQITYAIQDTLEQYLKTVQNLNQMRWGQKPENIKNWEQNMFRYCLEKGCLFLPILWDGTHPMSGRIDLIDHKKRTIYFYYTGYDNEYAKLSPGRVLFGHTIQYAIENNLEKYDLLMGEDEYKYAFGGQGQEFVKTIVITRKSLRNIIANIALDLARQLRYLLRKING